MKSKSNFSFFLKKKRVIPELARELDAAFENASDAVATIAESIG